MSHTAKSVGLAPAFPCERFYEAQDNKLVETMERSEFHFKDRVSGMTFAQWLYGQNLASVKYYSLTAELRGQHTQIIKSHTHEQLKAIAELLNELEAK